MEKFIKTAIIATLGALVGATIAYATMPSEPRVETCYDYHTIEVVGDKAIDTYLPAMNQCN